MKNAAESGVGQNIPFLSLGGLFLMRLKVADMFKTDTLSGQFENPQSPGGHVSSRGSAWSHRP